jgi:hypothetical protein
MVKETFSSEVRRQQRSISSLKALSVAVPYHRPKPFGHLWTMTIGIGYGLCKKWLSVSLAKST